MIKQYKGKQVNKLNLLGIALLGACTMHAMVTEQLPSRKDYVEQRIVVVAASYNNARWYRKHLNSIFNQRYQNWFLIYIDDASNDGTGELVSAYIKQADQQDRCMLMRNEKRLGSPLANQCRAISLCDPHDIIVIVDGDDFLAHSGVFKYINNVYQDPDVWLTYGQFAEWPNGAKGFCCPFPQEVVENNTFRKWPHLPSHLRTFRSALFMKIDLEDLMYEGKIFTMAGDLAAMMPMIEMASCGHFRFISEVLLLYNNVNPLSEHHVSRAYQKKMDEVIRSRPVYRPLENLYEE